MQSKTEKKQKVEKREILQQLSLVFQLFFTAWSTKKF